jgi:hypothetical protein
VIDATFIAHEADAIMTKLAAVQPAEGTKIDALDAWVWVQAFCDFDYEYAWLLDVRHNASSDSGDATESDYLAVFKGYDAHGTSVYRATWHRHPVVFPEVPNLYDALSWWATWVKDTRGGFHESGEAG